MVSRGRGPAPDLHRRRRPLPAARSLGLAGAVVLLLLLAGLAGTPPSSARGPTTVRPASTQPGNPNGTNGSGPRLEFTVTFLAQGLPLGAVWSVDLGGTSERSSSATLSFNNTPEGEVNYTVAAPSGYDASPSRGTVEVTTTTEVAIQIRPSNSAGSAYLGPFPRVEVEIVLLIVALGAVGIVGAEVWDRRRPKAPPEDR